MKRIGDILTRNKTAVEVEDVNAPASSVRGEIPVQDAFKLS